MHGVVVEPKNTVSHCVCASVLSVLNTVVSHEVRYVCQPVDRCNKQTSLSPSS